MVDPYRLLDVTRQCQTGSILIHHVIVLHLRRLEQGLPCLQRSLESISRCLEILLGKLQQTKAREELLVVAPVCIV